MSTHSPYATPESRLAIRSPKRWRVPFIVYSLFLATASAFHVSSQKHGWKGGTFTIDSTQHELGYPHWLIYRSVKSRGIIDSAIPERHKTVPGISILWHRVPAAMLFNVGTAFALTFLTVRAGKHLSRVRLSAILFVPLPVTALIPIIANQLFPRVAFALLLPAIAVGIARPKTHSALLHVSIAVALASCFWVRLVFAIVNSDSPFRLPDLFQPLAADDLLVTAMVFFPCLVFAAIAVEVRSRNST